jgi:ATP phosphoribosyltransferase regulatory subunit HisZ
MDEMKYAMLTEVTGRWRAEILESFLEADGIDVELFQDSLSQTFYTDPFAPVQVFVPKEVLERARELLNEFADSFDNEEEDEEDNDELNQDDEGGR